MKVSKNILILCEDEKSSLFYLDSFKKDEKLKRELAAVSIDIYQPKDFSPIGLVEEAKRRKKAAKRERNKFDEIWVVLDRDGHANMAQALERARHSGINVALSVICFEYWILLHFERTTKPFKKCDDVISHIKKNHFADYDKSSNAYLSLSSNTANAIKNGEWLINQVQIDIDRGASPQELGAYTNLHLLVRKLFEPKKFL